MYARYITHILSYYDWAAMNACYIINVSPERDCYLLLILSSVVVEPRHYKAAASRTIICWRTSCCTLQHYKPAALCAMTTIIAVLHVTLYQRTKCFPSARLRWRFLIRLIGTWLQRLALQTYSTLRWSAVFCRCAPVHQDCLITRVPPVLCGICFGWPVPGTRQPNLQFLKKQYWKIKPKNKIEI